MIKAIPFDPLHLEFMDVDPAFASQASREDPAMLARSAEAYSFIDDETGNVVAVIGAMKTFDGCCFLWSIFSTKACKHLLTITRFAKRWLLTLGFVRMECTVMSGFRPGHRWMRILGFKRETTRPMKKWDGIDDFHLYSKVVR